MVWGAISYGKKYPLVKIDVTKHKFTGQRYTDEILRPHLSKHLNYLRRYGQRHARVVEDGARIHWKKSLQGERARLKMANLPHPPYSPDLNPIENMWAMVKYKLRKRSHIPTSEDELWEAIEEAWESIPLATVNRLIGGMPRRAEEVKANKGFSISF
jgi:transposase